MSLADVAEEVDCAKLALRDLAARHKGFAHRPSLIVVPRYFIEEPLELFHEK